MMAFGLGQAIPLNGSEMAQLNEECAKMHYRKALSYETQHRYPRAIFELRLALIMNRKAWKLCARSLSIWAKAGLFDDAEKLYQNSFNISKPESTEDAFAHADYAYLLVSGQQTQ